MPYDHDQIDNLDAVLDDLDSPTTLETYQATDGFDPGMVAASAAKRAIEGGGGGGSTGPFTTVTLAFDTPGFAVQSFPITAVDTDAGTVTIAGDHAALFPVDAAASIALSTGNDGEFVVVDVAVVGGDTVVTTGNPGLDPTVDGVLVNLDTAGVVISEDTCYLMDVLNVTVAFGAQANVFIGPQGAVRTSPVSTYTPSVLGPSFYNTPFAPMHALGVPLVAILFDNNNKPSTSTEGEATLLLGMLP